MTISRFIEEYYFLSNFYPASVEYNGLTYKNSEAAFQAQKCTLDSEKLPFTEYTAVESKRAGRKVKLRDDWERVKLDVMEDVVRCKFLQNPEILDKLIATKDAILIEGNHWGDKYWGVDVRTSKGENHLGEILMKIRKELA